MPLQFVNEESFRYFCRTLTFDKKDLEVLDSALRDLNQQNQLPSRMIANGKANGAFPDMKHEGAQIIVTMDKLFSPSKGSLAITTIAQHEKGAGLTPALHLNLRSPTLKIPQRFEIPLRYMLQGLPTFKGKYLVYLHALEVSENENFVYYGITKRCWMRRFGEHMKSALRDNSARKFPNLLGKSIHNRVDAVFGKPQEPESPELTLTGTHHVVCAAGLTKESAQRTEAYLISKHSLKKEIGLNMIRGKDD